MAMMSKTNQYDTSKGILQFPDDYVCNAQLFPKDSPLAKTVGSRKIIKAGTPFPANDASCTGIVFNDYDVTDGDENGAVLVRGHVNVAKAQANAGVTYAAGVKTSLAGRVIFYPIA